MGNNNKNILLTGGTGFLGTHLLRALSKKNNNLIILKRSTSKTDNIKQILNLSNIKSYNIDKIKLENIFKENKIDIIIHTATSYGRNKENLKAIKEANYILPLKLLHLGIKNNTSLFINSDTFLTKKNDQSPKNHNYILSKKYFLKTAKEEIKNSKITFANLIIEHMYGPADNPSKIIPWLIKQLLKNSDKIALNNGKQKRDFIYVDDVVKAFLDTIKNFDRLNQYEDFGIGTGKTTSFKNLVNLIKKHTSSNTTLGWDKYPTDPRDCAFSCAKTTNNKKIGWKPTFSLNIGIKKTVEYYK